MADQIDGRRFIEKSAPFLEHIVEWRNRLPSMPLDTLISESEGSGKVAVILVDLIEGFARLGNLASPRVEALIQPGVRLVIQSRERGVRNFISLEDTHPPDSPEFDDFCPHCIVGTPESQIVGEFAELPFFNEFVTFPKSSLNAFISSGLDAYFRSNRHLKSIVILGDCTDLCVYQTAMHMKMMANARDEAMPPHPLSIFVPAGLVDTYDLSVATALDLNLKPHDGDFFHLVFLYHMYLNGIRVVSSIT